jgi:hypothetical protein
MRALPVPDFSGRMRRLPWEAQRREVMYGSAAGFRLWLPPAWGGTARRQLLQKNPVWLEVL